jgi:hypothetical protein
MKVSGAGMNGGAVVALHRQRRHPVLGQERGGGKPNEAAADDQNVGLDHYARPGFRANRVFLID